MLTTRFTIILIIVSFALCCICDSPMKLVGGGSSLAYVVQDSIAKVFTPINDMGAVITYTSVGSSRGITNLINREYAFAGSDSLVTTAQYKTDPDLQMIPLMAGYVYL
jgi:ABC-type phosphate transport system substrate-binding protein